MAHTPLLTGSKPRCTFRAVSSSQLVTQLRLAGAQVALIDCSGGTFAVSLPLQLQLVPKLQVEKQKAP